MTLSTIDPLRVLSSLLLCSYQRLVNWTVDYYELHFCLFVFVLKDYYEMMVGVINNLLQNPNTINCQ